MSCTCLVCEYVTTSLLVHSQLFTIYTRFTAGKIASIKIVIAVGIGVTEATMDCNSLSHPNEVELDGTHPLLSHEKYSRIEFTFMLRRKLVKMERIAIPKIK